MKFVSLLVLLVVVALTCAKLVTISNSQSRLDTAGSYVDCHSGNIIKHGDTYYMWGEHYNNTQGWHETRLPHLYVYTSPDLISWTNHGPMLIDAPNGTYYTPWVIFNNQTQMFVAWFNVYPNGCCKGTFGVAQSKDGIYFEIVSLNITGKYPLVDCNGLFVDDDGSALNIFSKLIYVIYSSIEMNHTISIEKLTPDYLNTTRDNYGFFPDNYVEGPVLFKRNGTYYVGYGSCCCFCRAGSGFNMFSASNITGPWKRLGADKNCNTTTIAVCGAYGDRISPTNLTINAQGITVSKLPTASGDVYLWQAERWLSAPFNNPACPDECRPAVGICEQPPQYMKGHGFSYWIPFEFEDNGDIKPFAPFVDSFTLDLL